MIDYYDLCGTPAEEPCAQTGNNEYHDTQQQRIEIAVFKEKILREIGSPPKGFVRFKTITNPHDFGDYLSLRIEWDDNVIDEEKWWNYINKIEAIGQWSREDLQKLIELGYEAEKILGEDRVWKAPQLS